MTRPGHIPSYRIELSNEKNGNGVYVANIYADGGWTQTVFHEDRAAARVEALAWIAADRDYRLAGTETIEL